MTQRHVEDTAVKSIFFTAASGRLQFKLVLTVCDINPLRSKAPSTRTERFRKKAICAPDFFQVKQTCIKTPRSSSPVISLLFPKPPSSCAAVCFMGKQYGLIRGPLRASAASMQIVIIEFVKLKSIHFPEGSGNWGSSFIQQGLFWEISQSIHIYLNLVS